MKTCIYALEGAQQPISMLKIEHKFKTKQINYFYFNLKTRG